jgi:hypothetical protein
MGVKAVNDLSTGYQEGADQLPFTILFYTDKKRKLNFPHI